MYGKLRDRSTQSKKMKGFMRRKRTKERVFNIAEFRIRKAIEQAVLVATDRDPKGQLVWEKSSIIVTKSEPQERAFEAARVVLAAKMEKAHASL